MGKPSKIPSLRIERDDDTSFISRSINPFSSLSDYEIWEALKGGDQKALEFIYNEYLPPLFRFGCQITSNRELVKDCIQDIFIIIGRNGESSVKVNSIKSYLFKALYREIIRKKSKYRFENLKLSNPESFGINLSVEELIIRNDQKAERLEKVKAGFNKLTEKQRQAILHYYYDGFTYDEIADIMDIQHKNTIAKLISRAIDMLRKSIVMIFSLQVFYN